MRIVRLLKGGATVAGCITPCKEDMVEVGSYGLKTDGLTYCSRDGRRNPEFGSLA